METMSYTGTLVITSCYCGINVGIPSNLYRRAKDYGSELYCPLGHQFWFKKTRVGILERDLASTQQRLQAQREHSQDLQRQRDAVERSRRATRAVLTKTKKRLANGKCPCCKQTFPDLGAHISTEHPSYGGEPKA